MKCGSCRGDHDYVADVRACYSAPAREAKAGDGFDNRTRVEKEHATLEDGFYTVVFTDGNYRTIRLRTQSKDAGFAPGEQVAAYLSGPDNESDYQGFAFLKPDGQFNIWKRYRERASLNLRRALEVLTQDPETAGQEYALRSNRCRRCNRTLTVPASINRGYGPVCDGLVA